MTKSSEGAVPREAWEDEVFFEHRWGAHGEKASEEHARLKGLWDAAQPFPTDYRSILVDIIALEICNWNLEESVLELCSTIGEKQPSRIPIGHMASVTDDRWRQVWAYYLTLRNWLPCLGAHGHEALLGQCDPDGAVRKHILGMLGERTDLKELYVERVCYCLEFWIGGYYVETSRPTTSTRAWERGTTPRCSLHRCSFLSSAPSGSWPDTSRRAGAERARKRNAETEDEVGPFLLEERQPIKLY